MPRGVWNLPRPGIEPMSPVLSGEFSSTVPQGKPCLSVFNIYLGSAGGSVGKESACNVGDLGSISGLGRFPWRRERLPILVFFPREFHGLYSPCGHKELDRTEQLTLFQ